MNKTCFHDQVGAEVWAHTYVHTIGAVQHLLENLTRLLRLSTGRGPYALCGVSLACGPGCQLCTPLHRSDSRTASQLAQCPVCSKSR